MSRTNQSLVTEFVIVGFPGIDGTEGFLFMILMIIYIFTICGNLAIITIITTHHHLHVPLYIFVANLSFLEIWYTTVTIPKMLANLLTNKIITFVGCLLQIYFLHFLGITETYFLTAMAYDRYMAICNPLRYPSIMTTACCFQLLAGSWLIGVVGPLTQILLLSRLSYCGSNKVEHIFCDFTPLINLACSDTSLNVTVDTILNFFIISISFSCIILSYVRIISAVLKISTSEGRKKAFSTCGAHLTVVLIFYGSVSFMYIRVTKHYPPSYDRIMAVIYSILTPMCNPIIYSLRNREIKDLLRKKMVT